MGKITRKVMMIGGAITPPRIPMEWTWRQLATEPFWNALQEAGVPAKKIGTVGGKSLKINDLIDQPLDKLEDAFYNTLPRLMDRVE